MKAVRNSLAKFIPPRAAQGIFRRDAMRLAQKRPLKARFIDEIGLQTIQEGRSKL